MRRASTVAYLLNVAPAALPRIAFPCLPDGTNRYIGCVGVGRCQQQGTPRCLFSRWATPPYRTAVSP